MTATLSSLKIGSLELAPAFRPTVFEYELAHSGAGEAAITWTLNGESSLKNSGPNLVVKSPATSADMSISTVGNVLTLTLANSTAEGALKIKVYESSTGAYSREYVVNIKNTASA